MAQRDGAKHTAARRGKKVLIRLRDGREFVDVFIERKGGTIFLKNNGRIYKDEIDRFLIWKPRK